MRLKTERYRKTGSELNRTALRAAFRRLEEIELESMQLRQTRNLF